VAKAAEVAGRNRSDFYKILKKYGIPFKTRKKIDWDRPIPEEWLRKE
jgi:hypothetical protein